MEESKKGKPRGRNGSPPTKPPRIYRGCLIVNLEWLSEHREIKSLDTLLRIAKTK